MANESIPVEDLPRIRDDRFAHYYSNWVQAGHSPWDISLLFGHVREAEPNKGAIVEVAAVFMTPHLAKALLATLAGVVKEYERLNGEIAMPGVIKRAIEERSKSQSPSASVSPSTSPSPSASASPSEPESSEDEE